MNSELKVNQEYQRRPFQIRVLANRIREEFFLLKSMIQDGIFTDRRGSKTLSKWRRLKEERVTASIK